jgi:hypothetical protein
MKIHLIDKSIKKVENLLERKTIALDFPRFRSAKFAPPLKMGQIDYIIETSVRVSVLSGRGGKEKV